MNRADILYDHYKETVLQQEKMIKVRNRFFVYLMVAIIIFGIWGINPYEMFEQLKCLLERKYELKLHFQYYFAQSFLWILYSYLLVRYYQAVIYVERQYKYIEQLECDIGIEIKYRQINRESGAYLRGYPFALTLIHSFYNFIVPMVILATCWQRIYLESIQDVPCLFLLFDLLCVVFASVIIINFIYFVRKTF